MKGIKGDISQVENRIREDMKHQEKMLRDDIRDLGNKIDSGNKYLADVINRRVSSLDDRLRGVEDKTTHLNGKIAGGVMLVGFVLILIQLYIKTFPA